MDLLELPISTTAPKERKSVRNIPISPLLRNCGIHVSVINQQKNVLRKLI